MKGCALRITIFGVVQGVGFRPFIYRLAVRHGLAGWVKNAGRGVDIHVEAPRKSTFEPFLAEISRNAPPLARIERLTFRRTTARGYSGFSVRKSRGGESFVFIAPDIATCSACRADIRNPRDRRYRYPFTNCTDCGPRYTIVRALPYDRPNTAMAGFPMCPECAAEYENPLDRRYHAQPVACPRCGPAVRLYASKTGREEPGGIERAAALVKNGRILSVKGLGGFHLMCDPLNPAAVGRLRKIKKRATKPLALMARDLDAAARFARCSGPERRLLLSERRPIVLLKKKTDIPGIAPNLDEVGIMLPYTPLHHLLLEDLGLVVATSSNRKDAPILKEDGQDLAALCDFVLTHDRPIEMQADDSVVKVVGRAPLFLRRARGYVPYPQPVPDGLRLKDNVLALGAELKDTVSVYKDGYVVTSQFLGDQDEYENRGYFEEAVRHLTRLFNIKPACVASDLHPDFHTTRRARAMGIPHIQVQHHHAHVCAVLLEHGIAPGTKVLGVSWDGYGYGPGGAAWGAEFLIADYLDFERYGCFAEVPLPGGDLAAKQPWRMALAYLHAAGFNEPPRLGNLAGVEESRLRGVLDMIRRGVRSPLASSCGRLFDAVSALTGLAPLTNEFEAEAALRLESAAAELARPAPYSFDIEDKGGLRQVSFRRMIRRIAADLGRGVSPARISARFHATLADALVRIALRAKQERGVETAVLCGGCFMNARLLTNSTSALARHGFRVLRPVVYSPNDESISLGQVACALARRTAGKTAP
jgi:hydrogenase maturation protein HypF